MDKLVIENEEIKKIDPFEKRLEECDYEVKVKFFYLDNLLCDCDDKRLEIFEEIEKTKVDIELYSRLQEVNRVRQLENQLDNLNAKYGVLEEKYDVLLDMYDEEILRILA